MSESNDKFITKEELGDIVHELYEKIDDIEEQYEAKISWLQNDVDQLKDEISRLESEISKYE